MKKMLYKPGHLKCGWVTSKVSQMKPCLWEDGDEYREKAVSVQERCRQRKLWNFFFSPPCLELELNEIAAKHAALFRNVLNTSKQVDRL